MEELLQKTDLYEQDYYLWLLTTLNCIQDRKIDQIDWKHLSEEIEALGNEQRRKVDSFLKQLLIHLLMYKYWVLEKDYCAKGWSLEIDNFRDELEFLLKSKTLYNYFLAEIDLIYLKARKAVIKKTGLSGDIFPDNCPFTSEEILNFDFLP
jgi:hypothetical protein